MRDENDTNGIMIGIVSSLDDEGSLGRVKVTYPHLGNTVESYWARLSSPMAGAERGAFFRPEVGDEVLVALEHGDPRRPYILGALWSQTDKPPPDDGNKTANNWRFIRSRCGHIILLDDTPGKEKIELIDKDSKRRITIDSATTPPKITVISEGGDVEIKAPNGQVLIEADNVTVRANKTLHLEGSMTTNVKGGTVNIN
jgi:uncharacterized protein involved in type VI secretion and phage assembly